MLGGLRAICCPLRPHPLAGTTLPVGQVGEGADPRLDVPGVYAGTGIGSMREVADLPGLMLDGGSSSVRSSDILIAASNAMRVNAERQLPAMALSPNFRPFRLLTAPTRAGILAAYFGAWVGSVISVALGMIVDGYVSLNNRQALEELREHRQRLRMQLLLKRGSAFDPGKSIELYETEVAMIETGLAKLGDATS